MVLLTFACLAAIAPCAASPLDTTPSIKLKTTTGRTITSASVAGKLVVIHFWSMQSRPCFKAAPVLVDLHEQYAHQGVAFVGVCLDRVTDDQAAAVAAKLGFNWFQTVDARNGDNRLAPVFEANSVPVTVVISTKGRVLWTGHPVELEPQIAFGLKAYPPRSVVLIDYEIAVESLQRADALTQQGDFVEALRLIDNIASEVKPDLPMKQLAHRINQQLRPTTGAKAQALNLAKAKYPAALDRLTALQEAKVVAPAPIKDPPTVTPNHPGVSSVSQATLISQLKLAERYAKADNDIKAYDVYVWIVTKAPQTQIGQEAAKKVAAFEADPAFMARHKVLTEIRLSEAQLDFAIELEKLQQIEPARTAYLKLIADFPRSLAAAKAKIRMDKLPAKKDTD